MPLTIMTSALPLAHPERLTTSWIGPVRSGVRWFGPASPRFHGTGDQLVAAVVRGRVETLPLVRVKVVGLLAACPRKVRLVVSLCDSLALNWT